jgi:hypothetical protein
MKISYRHLLSTVAVLSAGLLSPGSSLADTEPNSVPEVARVSTPVYHPDFDEFQPAFGKYEYTVSWEGIPAAEASISIEQ